MAFSKIQLTFSRKVEIGEVINFAWRDLDINGGATTISNVESCVAVRTGKSVFEVWSGTDANGGKSLLQWFPAYEADYNNLGLFTIQVTGGNVILITAKKDNIEFLGQGSNAGVSFVVTNEAQIPNFKINSIEYLEANVNPCDNIRVRVTTGTPMLRISSPVFIDNVNNTVVEFDYPRNTTVFVAVADANKAVQQIETFKDFLNNPTVKVTTTPSGATVTVSSAQSPGTNVNALTGLTYSLDGINYQSSKVFSGILDGNFTAYAKDIYGCVKTTPFTVESFTPDVGRGTETAYISNSNSIRFKKNEVWNNNTIFRNDTNTLSYEEKAQLCVPFIHKFTDQDDIKIQLKTNYETVSVSVYNCTTKTTTNPVVLPITSNLNKVDKRDAIGYEFPDGERYGFYFQTGNIYDPNETLPIITGSYALYGAIPPWGKIGNYFAVDGLAYAKIVDIIYEDSLSAYVLVTDISFAGDPVNVILQANYNVFNWEAYEFNIDMSPFLNEEIQVTIDLTDSDFETVQFVSEKIQVYSDLSDFVTIRSKNTTNNDIVYQSGIEHTARLEYDLFSLSDESELEIEKGDDSVYQLNTYSYAKKKLSLTRLSTALARTIRQQLSLDTVVIDGISCKIEEIGEPSRIGVTNVYKMEVTLYEVENKLVSNIVDTDVELDIVDVPALIIGNDEFVKQ